MSAQFRCIFNFFYALNSSILNSANACNSCDWGPFRNDVMHQVWGCPFLSLIVPICLCLSMSVPAFSACPCLTLSVPVCPCLSLSVSTFAIPACLPLQMNIIVFISMKLITLTFLPKNTIPMHATLFLTPFLLLILLPKYLFHSIQTVLF